MRTCSYSCVLMSCHVTCARCACAAVVPWVGHAPECEDPRWPEFFTQAPMARYVADLPLALEVLAGDQAPRLRLDEKVSTEHRSPEHVPARQGPGPVWTPRARAEA